MQSKMYIPSYYSMRDVNDDASNSSWSLHHENKALMNGQYYDLFLTRQTVEGYLGYEKEQLRQTILRHESIFRHQLRELHRLYKRQRDLMNEIKSKELLKHSIPAGASQSSLFSSRITSDDAKKTWHIPDSPLVDSTSGRRSMSCTDSIQSPFSFIKGKIMQANGVHTQNGGKLKDCEVLESHSKKLHRRLIDLELPADDYISNEEEQLEEKVSGLSRVESYSHNRNCKVPCESNVNLYIAGGMSSGCNGEASRSHLYSRESHGLTDLNKPIQVEEASTSASVDILGDITCSKEEVRRQDLSVNSHSDSQCLSKEFSQNLHRGSNESICLNNLHLENERYQKEWLSYKFGAGLTRSGRNSCQGGFCADDLPEPSDSSQVEARKVHEPGTFLPSEQNKTGEGRKRTIFGVEISERNPDVSVLASHGSCLHPTVAQSDVLHSESSSVSSWSKLPSCFSQSPISIHENSCSNRSHVTSNSRLNPSFRAEVSYQNGLSLGSQLEARESQICYQSNASDYPNGFSNNHSASEQLVKLGPMKFFKDMSTDVKPAKGLCTDAIIPNYNEVISQQHVVPVSPREPSISKLDEQRKNENSWGGLPWLKAKPLCSGESSKGKEASYQMNLDFLQTCSQTFSNKPEIGNGPSQTLILDSTSETCDHDDEQKRVKVGDCQSTKKILGIPIFCKPYSFKDLSSPNSPSKSSCVASAVDGDNIQKFGLLNTDLGCDSSKSGELLKVEGMVVEKGLVNQIAESRHHIDLNLCVVEEEPPSTHSSPRTNTKIAADIDLEAPVVLEIENVVSPRRDSFENQLKKPSKLLKDVSGELPDELVRVAVEAIIAISLSPVHDTEDVATFHPSETSMKGSLHWLADVISLCKGDPEKEVGAVSRGACDEDSVLDGLDYFEFMTLNLTETEVEEHHCEPQPQALEDQKDDEKMLRRPRKGQARRGRQRKDFQRDILPSLASLSRYEITEDIHTIEELFKATGSTWQSNLAQRGAAKSGRGRRRLRGSTPSPTVTTVCPPPILLQPNSREVGLEERSLTGWGKRTRRPPRQRYPNSNAPLALK